MEDDDKEARPLGLPYHEVYLPAEPITDDSRRFRVRYAFVDEWNEWELWKHIVGATGVEAFGPDGHSPPYGKAIHVLSFSELLLVMYHVVHFVAGQEQQGYGNRGITEKHIKAVQGLLKEERLAWEMDRLGGIHPLRDAAYSASREAAIAGLNKPHFANARAEFKKFVEAFDGPSADNKAGVRAIFHTTEALFKVRYATEQPERLTAGEIRKRLGSDFAKVPARYAPEKYTAKANNSMVESFADWCDAAQQYRHEKAGEPDAVDQPPNEIALLLVSSGIAFIRWLISIHPE